MQTLSKRIANTNVCYFHLQLYAPKRMRIKCLIYIRFSSFIKRYIRGEGLADHVAIDQPLTTLEQWKASKHRLLWVVVINRDVIKRDTPSEIIRVRAYVPFAAICCLIYSFLRLLTSRRDHIGSWHHKREMIYWNFLHAICK